MFWRPRSLRFRYTLRALLIFITLFMLWGGYHANRGWRERRAEATLLDRGGISLEFGARPGANAGNPALNGYWWVVGKIWRERFISGAVVTVPLERPIADALGSLPHLKSLNLNAASQRAQTVKGSVPRILSRGSLTTLFINGYKLDEEDGVAIGRHHSLVDVTFIKTQLSEQTVKAAATLPNLRRLCLSSTDVAGFKLQDASGSATLEWVECRGTPLQREFAEYLARCPRLTRLWLLHPSVDDDFVETLGGHPTVAELELAGTSITDRSLATIQSMPSLKSVSLPRHSVTAQSVTRFKSTRPSVSVLHR